MSEHSPLPWRHALNMLLDAEGRIVVVVSGEPDENLDLIVRAVNNHEKLVDSLSELLKALNRCPVHPPEAAVAIRDATEVLHSILPTLLDMKGCLHAPPYDDLF